MKKLLSILIPITILLLFLAGPVSANLLTSSDFTSVTLSYNSFSVNSGAYDTWLANGEWAVVNDGNGQGGAGDYWARHNKYAQPIFQGIAGQSPGLYEISLDYIFEEGAAGATPGRTSLYVFGLTAGESFSRFNNVPADMVQGTVLYSHELTPPTVDDWTSFADTFLVNALYDAWVYVVWTEAYQGGTTVPGLRGIDNASLNAVPEPATMLLLGFGLIGIAGISRKKFK